MVTKKMARKFHTQQYALQRKDAEVSILSEEEKRLRKQRRLFDFDKDGDSKD